MQTIIKCDQSLTPPTMLLEESSPQGAIEKLIKAPVEACSEYSERVISTQFHAFISALHSAFVDHRPFVLSPDMIWLLISQGFSNHVNENSEAMRHHFVSHQEKKKIEVRRDGFVKGSLQNPWENVFEEFSEHIKNEIGELNHNHIVVNFSTTGPIEKAANEIVLMDSMKSYFEYIVKTRCGIPEVRLEGNYTDWNKIFSKTKELGEIYDIEWWTNRMLPALKEIALHANGEGSPSFWKDIYKWDQGSGGPYINGWICDFIPYISIEGKLERNILFTSNGYTGITADLLPSGLSKVPFIWDYLSTKFNMEFIAGFTSYTQDHESFAIRPKIGWAIREKPENT